MILAHYYQDPDIQDLADFIGDSLQLAKAARDTDADVIVFCGVHFMAETAKILNPGRIVLIPDMDAGRAHSPTLLLDRRCRRGSAAHPNHQLVSYVNCSAEVKAVSDIICTSSNAESVIASIPDDQGILFISTEILVPGYRSARSRDDALAGTRIVHETLEEKRLWSSRSDTRMRR